MDGISRERRSEIMSAIRSGNTRPELAVRRLVRAMGYGYRLHRRDVPGTPDLAFIGVRKAIFVHGCFWHRHRSCARAQTPRSRLSYWLPKFSRTVARDRRILRTLHRLGWSTLVVWECELENPAPVAGRIATFLDAPSQEGDSNVRTKPSGAFRQTPASQRPWPRVRKKLEERRSPP